MKGLICAGTGLLFLGAIGHAGGVFYGLHFAYRPENEPVWMEGLFTTSLVAGVLGWALLVAGLLGIGRR
jgi:uncharacterized membrane protein